MKIGVCVSGDYDRLLIAKKYGYDYVESHCQNIVNMDDDTFDKFMNADIPVLAANCFVGMRVVGNDRDEKAISEYLDELFRRSGLLNIKVLVFGSSGARKMLDGDDYEEIKGDIVSFLKEFVAPRAEKYRIKVAVEPLRSEECNVINTVAQAVEIAKEVNSEYVRVLADVKHMVSSHDPLNVLPEYSKWLIHAHTSNPYPDSSLGKKRTYPKVTDSFNQAQFFNQLKKAGVEHCSIEADVVDFESDCRDAIEVLKQFR